MFHSTRSHKNLNYYKMQKKNLITIVNICTFLNVLMWKCQRTLSLLCSFTSNIITSLAMICSYRLIIIHLSTWLKSTGICTYIYLLYTNGQTVKEHLFWCNNLRVSISIMQNYAVERAFLVGFIKIFYIYLSVNKIN